MGREASRIRGSNLKAGFSQNPRIRSCQPPAPLLTTNCQLLVFSGCLWLLIRKRRAGREPPGVHPLGSAAESLSRRSGQQSWQVGSGKPPGSHRMPKSKRNWCTQGEEPLKPDGSNVGYTLSCWPGIAPKLWNQHNSSFPCFQRRKGPSPELWENKEDRESLHPEP